MSLLPGEYLPSAFDWWDKAQHALAFLALGSLGLLAYSATSGRVTLGLLIFGALIELAQSASGLRYGDWQDWLADAFGVGAAYGTRLIRRRLGVESSKVNIADG